MSEKIKLRCLEDAAAFWHRKSEEYLDELNASVRRCQHLQALLDCQSRTIEEMAKHAEHQAEHKNRETEPDSFVDLGPSHMAPVTKPKVTIEVHRNGEIFRVTLPHGAIFHVKDGDKVYSVGS